MIQDERAAFEAAMRRETFDSMEVVFSGGEPQYKSYEARVGWIMWQACAALNRKNEGAQHNGDAKDSPLLDAALELIAGSEQPRACADPFYHVPAHLWLTLQGEVMEQLRELARADCIAIAAASAEGST